MFDLTDIGLINPYTESRYHQRCNDIKEQLKSFDVKAEVSRHTFQDKKYYVLNVDLNHKNSYKTVAKALKVTEDDVHFIHTNLKGDYKILWISEELLHTRYLDGNGRLNFENIDDKAIRLINDDNNHVVNIRQDMNEINIKIIKERQRYDL